MPFSNQNWRMENVAGKEREARERGYPMERRCRGDERKMDCSAVRHKLMAVDLTAILMGSIRAGGLLV